MLRVKTFCVAAGIAALFTVSAPDAKAFCGFIEETATGTVAANAVARAERAVRRQLSALRKQHGKKLVVSKKSSSCIGGDGGIDAQGKRVKGYNRCTVTQGYCVNP